MSKKVEAVKAYYKAMHEEDNYADLTNKAVAELLTERLGFNVSETSARGVRVDLGLSTRKRRKEIVSKSSGIDVNGINAIKMLAKTDLQLIHIIVSLLNRSGSYDKTTKDSMLRHLDSMAEQTKQRMNFTGKTRKSCILGPRGTAIGMAKDLRKQGKNDQEIKDILNTEYIKVGLKGWEALTKAENIIKYGLNKRKPKTGGLTDVGSLLVGG